MCQKANILKMKKLANSQLLVFLILFASCAPLPVIRMNPLVENTEWDWGVEVVSLNQEGIEINLAYLQSTDQYLVFDLDIRNSSGEKILISPEQFYFEAFEQDTSTQLGGKVQAINPETQLLNIDRSIARENAEQSTELLMELTEMTVNTASGISNVGKSRPQAEVEAEEISRQESRDWYRQEEVEREFTFQSLNEQREYWANHILRKSHLDSRYQLRGRIIFPRYDKATFLKFNLPIENQTFEVVYRQKLVRSQY